MSLVLYGPLLLKGVLVTIGAWLVSGIFSFLLGTILGILSCQQLTVRPLKFVIRFYTFIAKGIPAYVQILIAYFVIPNLLGVNIPGFWAATGALAFCSSGYVAEIIRAGINSISQGQWQACQVLGYPIKAALWRVILPQVFRNILPGLFGEFEQLLKSTALLATIGITELTRTGMNIISRELNPVPVYSLIALIYLVLAALWQGLMVSLEKRGQNGSR